MIQPFRNTKISYRSLAGNSQEEEGTEVAAACGISRILIQVSRSPSALQPQPPPSSYSQECRPLTMSPTLRCRSPLGVSPSHLQFFLCSPSRCTCSPFAIAPRARLRHRQCPTQKNTVPRSCLCRRACAQSHHLFLA